jgi:toxin YoeB
MPKHHNFNYYFDQIALNDIKKHKEERNFQAMKIIYELLDDIGVNGELKGKGKPKRLRRDYKGFYSRRINEVDRLVYKIIGNIIVIVRCKGHYND